MPVSRDKNSEKSAVKSPAANPAANSGKRSFALKDTSQMPTKRTINLCMREKSGISAEGFLIALASILVFIMLVEFVGVFLPYDKLDKLEADLATQQQALADKQSQYADYADVEKEYNEYNYNGFPSEINGRPEVIEMLERNIINNEKFKSIVQITRITISGNVVTISLTGDIGYEKQSELMAQLRSDEMVASVVYGSASQDDDGEGTVTGSIGFTITLKDASLTGGNN